MAIALECGFNTHSHFGRKFRQLTGMTPKNYRAQYQIPLSKVPKQRRQTT
jgi:AraC-like DNA-binding protein